MKQVESQDRRKDTEGHNRIQPFFKWANKNWDINKNKDLNCPKTETF